MSRQWMQNVAAAAGKSAERTRVPGIVSKLTSTLSKQQFMIDGDNSGYVGSCGISRSNCTSGFQIIF